MNINIRIFAENTWNYGICELITRPQFYKFAYNNLQVFFNFLIFLFILLLMNIFKVNWYFYSF